MLFRSGVSSCASSPGKLGRYQAPLPLLKSLGTRQHRVKGWGGRGWLIQRVSSRRVGKHRNTAGRAAPKEGPEKGSAETTELLTALPGDGVRGERGQRARKDGEGPHGDSHASTPMTPHPTSKTGSVPSRPTLERCSSN